MIFGDDAPLDCECSWPRDPDANAKRKRAKAFLPRKPASDPLLLVDMIGRSGFDLADQI